VIWTEHWPLVLVVHVLTPPTKLPPAVLVPAGNENVTVAPLAGLDAPPDVALTVAVTVCGFPTTFVPFGVMLIFALQVGKECIATSLNVEVKLCEERVSAMNVLKQALAPASWVRSMPPSKKVSAGKVAGVVILALPFDLNWYVQGAA
jgi:hypothetical protein